MVDPPAGFDYVSEANKTTSDFIIMIHKMSNNKETQPKKIQNTRQR